MRDLWNRLPSMWRRFRQRARYADGRTRWLAGRWLALGMLVFAVAAVTAWNGGVQSGGVQQYWWQIAVDKQEETVTRTASGDNLTQPDLPQTEKKGAPEVKDTGAADNVASSDTADIVDNTDGPEDTEESGDVYDHAPEPWANDAGLQAEADLLSLQTPLAGEEIRGYGIGYDVTFRDYRFHGGLDWQGAEGEPVLAALAGEVAELSDDPVYGQGVTLAHGEKLSTVYLGLIPAVGLTVGQQVEQGEEIGRLTAPPVFEDAEPPHLHWEVRLEGKTVDPADYDFAQ